MSTIYALALALLSTTFLLASGCATPSQTFKREQTIKVISDPPQASLWQNKGGDRVLLGKGEATLQGSYTVKREGFNPLFWLLPAGGAALTGGGAALAASGGKTAGLGVTMILLGASTLIPGVLGLIYRYREKGKERIMRGQLLSIRAELDGYEPAYLRTWLPSKQAEAHLKLKPRWFFPLGIARRADLHRPESVEKLIAGLAHKEHRVRQRCARALGARALRRLLSPERRSVLASALEKVARTDIHYGVRRTARATLSFYRRGRARGGVGGLGPRATPRGGGGMGVAGIGMPSARRPPTKGVVLKMLGGRRAPSSRMPRGSIVAAFDLRDRSGKLSRSARAQLSEYWATVLAEGGRFKVVPRARLRGLIAEQKKKSYKHCYESRCQIELGRALAAQKAIAISLLRLGKRCTLTARLFDLKTETAERAATVHGGCRVEQLSDGLRLLAMRLAR